MAELPTNLLSLQPGPFRKNAGTNSTLPLCINMPNNHAKKRRSYGLPSRRGGRRRPSMNDRIAKTSNSHTQDNLMRHPWQWKCTPTRMSLNQPLWKIRSMSVLLIVFFFFLYSVIATAHLSCPPLTSWWDRAGILEVMIKTEVDRIS